jgi:hypothetical protein
MKLRDRERRRMIIIRGGTPGNFPVEYGGTNGRFNEVDSFSLIRASR